MTLIGDAVKTLAKQGEVAVNHLQVGTVTAVDWGKRTCTVKLDDGRERYNCKLRAIADDSATGVCFKPKVNSEVLLGAIEREEMNAIVLAYTEVESIEIKMPDVFCRVQNGVIEIEAREIKAKANQTTFNDGLLAGLVKLQPLVAKLNAIEADLNAVKAVFAAWLPVPGDGGAALFAAIKAWAGKLFTPTLSAELENTKIKQ